MPSLFDDTFEDDRPPEPARPAATPAPVPPAQAAPPAVKPRARTVYSVSALTAAIRDRLEQGFFQVWLEGEVSNARPASSGHLYFTLKDDGAQMKAVMFRSDLQRLRFKPADGQHVIARGRVSVYEARGEVQIICEHLEPRGLGALQLAFEQLKTPARRRGAVRSGAQAAAAAPAAHASASSPRSTAPQFATSCASSPTATPACAC